MIYYGNAITIVLISVIWITGFIYMRIFKVAESWGYDEWKWVLGSIIYTIILAMSYPFVLKYFVWAFKGV